MSGNNKQQPVKEPAVSKAPEPKKPEVKGKVFISAEAFRAILLYAKRYANENIPEYDWKEVYGFLIGRIDKDNVLVDSAVPMTSGEATEVVFGPSHYTKAAELDNEIAEKNDNTFVCGWWHSHPFKSNPTSIFLSSIDVGNHLGFQGPNPLAIALVHDPSKMKEKDTPFGIKVFRLTRTDFDQNELDRYALDLNPEGNTKSNPTDIVYYAVPFEITGPTAELFADSLADVIDKTVKGDPLIKAYREDDANVTVSQEKLADARKLTRIQDLGKVDITDEAGGEEYLEPDIETLDQTPSAEEPSGLPLALPEEMEEVNKTHVLSVEDFASGDEELRTEEAEQQYLDALDFKKQKEFKMAADILKSTYRIYSKLNAKHKMAFIKNMLMECYFWAGDVDDAIVESNLVEKLANETKNQYFLGNAREFRGRSFLKRGDMKNASQAFQDAIAAFKKGSFNAKAGACAEMIARIYYNREKPDVEMAITFFARALLYYQNAIKNPRSMEPAWARDAFITNHGALLEKQAKGLIGELKDGTKVKQMKELLVNLKPWD
nr:hypothetical protein [Candidatus Sigynarchaeota archaeon]